ncbi:MAG: putative sulfate exporter family transporter, partial [Bacteroidales bacterium]|nr:putative sulfate exporter family transporter [Bacteroidales bacterium]
MKNFWQKFLVEDWIVTFISIPLLIIAGFAYYLPAVSIPSDLRSLEAWGNLGFLFLLALLALFVGNMMLGRPVKKLLRGFVFIFIVAALALWIAQLPGVKYYGFEAVFVSVIFGLVIRNCFRIPEWLKPA